MAYMGDPGRFTHNIYFRSNTHLAQGVVARRVR